MTTQRGNTLYLHILNLNDDALFIPLDTKRIRQVRLFDGKSNLRYTASATGTTITLPSVPKAVDTIVEITLKN